MFHSRNVHYIPVPLACKKCATSNFPPRALDARSKCRARGDQHDGTSFSSLSLSLSFPLFHLWINNPNPSQQSLLSMAAKMLENAPSSAFWVRISIRRPLERRGSGPEQRQLSLSLFVFVVPAVRRISMWVNSVLDYARARMHDFQNEVSGGAHRTRRDTVSVLLQTKSKSLREGGGNCPRTTRGRWKFGIWDENRIRKKRIGWE